MSLASEPSSDCFFVILEIRRFTLLSTSSEAAFRLRAGEDLALLVFLDVGEAGGLPSLALSLSFLSCSCTARGVQPRVLETAA